MRAKIDELKSQAELFLEQNEKKKARACYQKILARERWRRDVPPRDLFEAHIKLGEIYASEGKPFKVTTAFERALNVAEKKFGPISSEVAATLSKLANAYQAVAEIQASQAVRNETDWHHVSRGEQVRIYWEGAYQRSVGRRRSLDCSERRQVIEKLLQEPSDSPARVAVLAARSRLSRSRGQFGAAASFCKQALQESSRQSGKAHPQTIRLRNALVGLSALVRCADADNYRMEMNARRRKKQVALAEQAIEEVRKVQGQIEQSDPLDLIEILSMIGLFYARHQRYNDAQPYFEQAFICLEKYSKSDDNALTSALCRLAQCACYQGRYDEAERYDLQALALQEKVSGEEAVTGYILDHLVQIYEKQGNKQNLIEEMKQRVKPIHAAIEAKYVSGRMVYQRGMYKWYPF